jgi:hypothetical protein
LPEAGVGTVQDRCCFRNRASQKSSSMLLHGPEL